MDKWQLVMANRLSKIVTKTGDAGETGLADGQRVGKNSRRITALGTVDELNTVLGVLLTEDLPADVAAQVLLIQHDLFDLGGELAIPNHVAITAAQVTALEDWLTALNADLPPLKEFILPGGSRAAAQCHMVRTVARRAERVMVDLMQETALNPLSLQYLNRLSDVFFVLARVLNRAAGQPDILWDRERSLSH